VIDTTEKNVVEVLVADNGKFEVSATDDVDEDSSDEEARKAEEAAMKMEKAPEPAPAPQLTAAELQQAAMNLGRAFSAPAPKPKPAPEPPKPKPEPPRERSRSPKRKAEASPPPDDPVDKMHAWKVLQGLEKAKEKPKVEEKRIGWLPDGACCSMCSKNVVDQGGVWCGRRRSETECGGCFEAICWKCMNKHRDKIGGIRTTKKEFTSLGPDAWWMHEKCMTPEDKKAYFGEDEEEEEEEVAEEKPKKRKKKKDDEEKFAWE